MRAEPTKLAARPPLEAGQTAGWVAVAGAMAAWTAVAVLARAQPDKLGLSNHARDALVYGVPALLGAALLFDSRLAALRPLRAAFAWGAIVALATLVADNVSHGHLYLLAVPALAVATVAVTHRPAEAVIGMLAISGFFGSLIAFWHFPNEKAVQLVLGGLALALVWRALIGARTYSLKLTLGLVLPVVYFYVTIVQVVLDAGEPAAWRGFATSTWFMLAVPVIALAGWSPRVHDRIAKGVIAVAGLVGLYAGYRWLTDISPQEFARWGSDRYNYVGGELRLLGSFPTGQDLGGWTALVVPFCVAMAFTIRSRWRVAALVSAALCLVALAGSQLRIAVVAVALGTITVVVLHEAARGFSGRRLGATLTGLVVMVALGIAAFEITGGTSDAVTHSYASLLHPLSRSDPSVNARLYKWQAAVRDLRAHPFGYGVGTANKQSTTLVSDVESIGQYDVDNGFLRVALEQGFLVMILFAAAVVLLTVDLVRKALVQPDRTSAGIIIGAAGMMISFLVLEWAVAFQDGPRALPIWIIAGLGLAQYTTR